MNVNDYMEQPYNYIIQSDGDTFDEAYKNLQEAMRGYIQTKLDNGFDVPLPNTAEDYSGKFVVRVPKSLHQALSIEAEREGVSLNQYALYKLSR